MRTGDDYWQISGDGGLVMRWRLERRLHSDASEARACDVRWTRWMVW
jgi:hypothetical protein